MNPVARLLGAFSAAPWWLKPLYVITWLAFVVIGFVASSSLLFVWLGKLGKHYPLTSPETYCQWLAYVPYHRNLSVMIWLIASAILPGMLIVLVHMRAFQRVWNGGSMRRPLYGKTQPADRAEMQESGLALKRKL